MARLRAMKDREIDYSDIPKIPDDFWDDAQVVIPSKKTGIYMRVDDDILEWFKERGPRYQTRINAILRTYVQSQHKVRKKAAM